MRSPVLYWAAQSHVYIMLLEPTLQTQTLLRGPQDLCKIELASDLQVGHGVTWYAALLPGMQQCYLVRSSVTCYAAVLPGIQQCYLVCSGVTWYAAV